MTSFKNVVDGAVTAIEAQYRRAPVLSPHRVKRDEAFQRFRVMTNGNSKKDTYELTVYWINNSARFVYGALMEGRSAHRGVTK